jgi:hypothetical protein
VSDINNWVWVHLIRTRCGDAADPEAALADAKTSEQWPDYSAVIEFRGWAALVNETKRRCKSGVLFDLAEQCGGQAVFAFLDGLMSTSRGLLFAEDVTLKEFDEVTRKQEEGINADTLRNNQRRAMRDMVAHLWEPAPALKLAEVLAKYAEEIQGE